MKLTIQKLALSTALVAFTTVATAADSSASSAEKARQALSTLQSGTPAEKALACKTLAVYGHADAVPALASLLADPQLASWARIALEVISGPAADEALRSAAGRLNGRLLVGVINSIGVRRDAKAVSVLTPKLNDADAEVASAAAVALGHIGGDQAAKALQESLPDASPEVRSAVAQGCILCAEQFLARKQYSKATTLYDVVSKADLPKQRILEATRGAILARRVDGIPLLLNALRSSDKSVLGIGLTVARELPGRAVTDALVAELGKTSSERQAPLLLALSDRDDPAVLPVILASAESGTKDLRLVAVEAMSRIGNLTCVPVLLDVVVEDDADLVSAAKTSLAALPNKEVDAQLAARLRQAAGDKRRGLIELAGQRQVSAAMPEMIKAAGDSDATIRAAGLKALGEAAGAADLGALTDLLAKAKSDEEISSVQEALESACAHITDKAACADKLLPALSSASTPAKCALLRVLVVVGTPNALDAVRTSISSGDAKVRDTAVRTLADWQEAPALPALLEIFRTTQDDSHRFLALRGCVRLMESSSQPAADKVKAFSDLLARTERVDDRKVILSGLANVADPAALRLVEPLVSNADVQAEAELAMLKIAGSLVKSAPAEAKAAATKLQAESKNEATQNKAAKILNELEKNR